MKIGIAFNKPRTIWGKFVKWRTGDEYSHSVVVMDDDCFSVELLTGVRVIPYEYYNEDLIFWFDISENDFKTIHSWLSKNEFGKSYDWLAIVGFMFGLKHLEDHNLFYCHELSRRVLEMCNLLNGDHGLITATSLIEELKGISPATQH